jgi:hypothetical protein
VKRPPSHPQRDPICAPITAALRLIESVPPGALWRVSWLMIPAGASARRQSSYLFTDASARKWCATQGIPFPGDQAVAEAARGDSTRSRAIVSGRIDVRARAAGDW